ncbi:MAG: septum formation initiator family protein [Oscillospiraceae bacterium]|nr:septum formation initiator family protein [Oscillospiraceae bacterium]
MRKTSTQKKPHKKHSLLLGVALAMFCVYMLVAVVSQQMQIRSQKAKLQSIQSEIQVQEIKNSDVRHELADQGASSEYIARVARESLNMAKAGERIFICPGGD